MAHNVKSLRSNLPQSATLIAVVKVRPIHQVLIPFKINMANFHFTLIFQADGYGHGAEWVGKAALEAGAQRLAVATLEEGMVER